VRADDVRMQAERPLSRPIDLLVAIAIPLALLALAYALWAISDRLLWIGPFDRAAFGWIVVAPLSWLAPGIAGLAWSPMPKERQLVAALIVGGTVAAVATALLANSIDYANCAPVTSLAEVLPASIAIGVVIGLGPALGSFVAASVAGRLSGLGRVAAAVATGGLIGFVGLFAAVLTFVFFFPLISCAPVH
jgi:hypothetical protein